MGQVINLPRKETTEYTSYMTLLRCNACNDIWFGLYHSGATVADLHCYQCGSRDLTSLQGERQVVFYEYD